jgi:LuxR family transcriptional regulator, regulator of acetate metabolism
VAVGERESTPSERPTAAAGREAWAVSGQPLEDESLRARIRELSEEMRRVLARTDPPSEAELLAFDAAEGYVERLVEEAARVLEQRADPALEAFRHVVELQFELANARLRHRSRAFARVQQALARLREVSSLDGIMQRIAEEVLEIGFDRVILSRVLDARWIPEIVVVRDDPQWAAEILRAGREQEQLLDHMLLETEMVRRRTPMLVRDAQGDPRAHRPIADSSLSRSYVAAPIMPEGRVIGFLHADCYTSRRDVDDFDRDILWMFAEGAGYAFERTALLERQRDLREQIHRMTQSIRETVDAVVDSEVEVARLDRQTAAATGTAADTLIAEISPLHELLTRREVEIARLMVTGMTNPQMARRLFITEGTVKTHVSNVLRKLGATNRAQAVSKFLALGG